MTIPGNTIEHGNVVTVFIELNGQKYVSHAKVAIRGGNIILGNIGNVTIKRRRK